MKLAGFSRKTKTPPQITVSAIEKNLFIDLGLVCSLLRI
jgi:hypothetical protein